MLLKGEGSLEKYGCKILEQKPYFKAKSDEMTEKELKMKGALNAYIYFIEDTPVVLSTWIQSLDALR